MMRTLPVVASTLALFLAPLAPGVAQAQDAGAPTPAAAPQGPVNAEVIVLHATNDGSGIDPKIGKMPQLAKPPFSSYNSYKLLDRNKLALVKGQAASTKLPNGREMTVTLKGMTPPAKKGDSARYALSASIQKPSGNTFLPLLEVNASAGETFFVAGQTYKGGILVIGIKVLP